MTFAPRLRGSYSKIVFPKLGASLSLIVRGIAVKNLVGVVIGNFLPYFIRQAGTIVIHCHHDSSQERSGFAPALSIAR